MAVGKTEKGRAQQSKGAPKRPTLANGKVSYIELPAVDIQRSADFYAKVFGWSIRQRSDGHTAFDDTTGEVSGTWVVGRPPSSERNRPFEILQKGKSIAERENRGQPPGRNSPLGTEAAPKAARVVSRGTESQGKRVLAFEKRCGEVKLSRL